MSCWTEYVIADADAAEAVANVSVPRDQWAGFEGCKGFGGRTMPPLPPYSGVPPTSRTSQI